MEKGMLVEEKTSYFVVMTKDGSFKRAKKEQRNYKIGGTLYFNEYREPKRSKIISVRPFKAGFIAVATLILILSQVFFLDDSSEVYAYMAIDIKPSMELSVNEDMQVVDIIAFNEDAEVVIAFLSEWENENVEVVAKQIIDICDSEGFLSDRDVVITTIIVEENKEPSQKLKKAIAEITVYSESKTHSVVVSREATLEEREKSNELNVSVGEYLEGLEEAEQVTPKEAVPVKLEKVPEPHENNNPTKEVDTLPENEASEEIDSNNSSSISKPESNVSKTVVVSEGHVNESADILNAKVVTPRKTANANLSTQHVKQISEDISNKEEVLNEKIVSQLVKPASSNGKKKQESVSKPSSKEDHKDAKASVKSEPKGPKKAEKVSPSSNADSGKGEEKRNDNGNTTKAGNQDKEKKDNSGNTKAGSQDNNKENKSKENNARTAQSEPQSFSLMSVRTFEEEVATETSVKTNEKKSSIENSITSEVIELPVTGTPEPKKATPQ